ncbi:MAG: hypothetical protein CM1200mP41_28230 [Gammaproteobacteria bacterium]|nr:MAG: hypothetical protein CM1200mP41_28230 [Gammaproteobacteria bacterium]
MAKLITIYWRDIPSQIVAKSGRRSAKVRLANRFQDAIDRAAMRAGKGSSDAYLSEWRRDSRNCSDDLEAEAQAAGDSLDQQFSDDDLLALIRSKGVAKAAEE